MAPTYHHSTQIRPKENGFEKKNTRCLDHQALHDEVANTMEARASGPAGVWEGAGKREGDSHKRGRPVVRTGMS